MKQGLTSRPHGLLASVILALCFTALRPLLPPDSARAERTVFPSDVSVSVDLGPRHGNLFISHREASVSSFRAHRATTYTAPARIGNSRVFTAFGKLGRITLQFERDGEPSKSKPSTACRGGTRVISRGTFRGVVELRSRFGFKPVDDSSFSGEGLIVRSPRVVCNLPKQADPFEKKGDGVGLWAQTCDGRGFNAQGRRLSAGAHISSHFQLSEVGRREGSRSPSLSMSPQPLEPSALTKP